jgi:hypothetical protein
MNHFRRVDWVLDTLTQVKTRRAATVIFRGLKDALPLNGTRMGNGRNARMENE